MDEIARKLRLLGVREMSNTTVTVSRETMIKMRMIARALGVPYMNVTIEYLIKAYESSLSPEEKKLFYAEYIDGIKEIIQDKLTEPDLGADEISKLNEELVILNNERTNLIGEAMSDNGNRIVQNLIRTHRTVKRELVLDDIPTEKFKDFEGDREDYLRDVPEEIHKVIRGKQGFVDHDLELVQQTEEQKRINEARTKRLKDEKLVNDAFK
jgi:hypothetical protein